MRPGAGAARAEVFSSGWREPVLLRFRQGFTAASASCRIHVSADERFELFVDGHRIARGPDRSDVQHWCYATYDLKLAPGNHRMEALVWNIGPNATRGATIVARRFCAEGGRRVRPPAYHGEGRLGGRQAGRLRIYSGVFFVGAQLTARDCGPQWKEGDYVKAVTVRGPVRDTPYGESVPGWLLFPTRLPDQLDVELVPGRAVAVGSGWLGRDVAVTAEQASHPELPAWQAVVEGKEEVVVPANTERFLLWDLENYYCAYPLCEVSGGAGAKMTWGWAESLYLRPNSEAKGNRGEFVGKYFRGMTDTFLPGGGAAPEILDALVAGGPLVPAFRQDGG